MTKRAFVLFFSLVHFMAFGLLSQQAGASCHFGSEKNKFSPNTFQSVQNEVEFADDSVCENETIVRSDDFEWKENLSSLLRHRNVTYRFLTACSSAIPDYSIAQTSKIIRESVTLPAINKGRIIRPGYYGFLHRLCPF